MNPYEVLGVSENADEDTIKRAYRELVKKYHPDKYINNPLADLASEKIKQINEAYDMIMNGRAGSSKGSAGAQGSATHGAGSSYSAASGFQEVRMLIQRGSLSAAEVKLAKLPRTAEWYYLSGVLHIRRGWYTEAHRDITQAVRMDPSNAEYRAALNAMSGVNTGYRAYRSGGRSGRDTDCCAGVDACSCCSNLICADCCCECMGGDLIPCC